MAPKRTRLQGSAEVMSQHHFRVHSSAGSWIFKPSSPPKPLCFLVHSPYQALTFPSLQTHDLALSSFIFTNDFAFFPEKIEASKKKKNSLHHQLISIWIHPLPLPSCLTGERLNSFPGDCFRLDSGGHLSTLFLLLQHLPLRCFFLLFLCRKSKSSPQKANQPPTAPTGCLLFYLLMQVILYSLFSS